MFERFTREARRIVEAAQQEARSVGASHVRPEHLLVALADRCSPLLFVTELAPPPPLGDPYPITAERLRAQLASEDPDAEALASLGISLAEVRRAVERDFGPDAWTPTREGRLPFAPETKRALEDALREAVELRTRRIGAVELLLGLLRHGEAVCVLVARCGVDPARLYERQRASLQQLARLAAS
jgi:ATP-dependent Clp protease ATP-binding subunit ClpA